MEILVLDTPSIAPVRVNSSTDLSDQPVPVSPTSTDGWGEIENGLHEEHESDKDGWDDIEPLEEPKPSPALANIQAAQKRPVTQTVSQPKQQGDIIVHLTVVVNQTVKVSRLNCLTIWPYWNYTYIMFLGFFCIDE